MLEAKARIFGAATSPTTAQYVKNLDARRFAAEEVKSASKDERILHTLGVPNHEEVGMVSNHTSVMGMKWLTLTDSLSFRWRAGLLNDQRDGPPKKRELLRVATSVSDRLGVVAYRTVLPRIILASEQRVGRHNSPGSWRPSAGMVAVSGCVG